MPVTGTRTQPAPCRMPGVCHIQSKQRVRISGKALCSVHRCAPPPLWAAGVEGPQCHAPRDAGTLSHVPREAAREQGMLGTGQGLTQA